MKVLVPIKRVVDPYAKVRPLADGSGVDTTGAKFEINPFDEIAVEEAVRLKEKGAATEVVVVSIGKAECEDQLRKALAIGADRAILVETDAVLDSPAVASLLREVVASENPSLVLMGKQATDDDCNQAGQMLAAKLDWPQATFAAKIEVHGSDLHVTRETDSGEQILSLPMPCLVTTDLRLNEPRYVALPGIIKARSKPLEKRAASSVQSPKTRLVGVELPPARPSGRKVGSVAELASAIKERGVL
ncbi:MAG: electron transfer flavoprotein subunit beta/FixA family protein [Armatimonadetes bacterium]|nr:electron transfer flavoprotein subunit beta/FixA family protein [Armatimonadota bacterium]